MLASEGPPPVARDPRVGPGGGDGPRAPGTVSSAAGSLAAGRSVEAPSPAGTPGGEAAGSPFTAPCEARKRRFFLSPELFIYPLVLVGICVLVFFFFAEIGGDQRTVAQLIADIRPRGVLDLQGPRRAAKELADRIQEMERQGRKLDGAETRQLLDVLEGLKS